MGSALSHHRLDGQLRYHLQWASKQEQAQLLLVQPAYAGSPKMALELLADYW